MPPKKAYATMSARGEEGRAAKSSAAESTTATATAGTLGSRPHHLVSRLHPHWSAPGSTASTGGPPPLHQAGATAQAARNAVSGEAKPATSARARGALQTRVAGRSAAAVQEERKPVRASGTLRAAAAKLKGNITTKAAVGSKRSRLQSELNPTDVDAEQSARGLCTSASKDDDDDEVDSNSSDDVSSSSPSLSPPAVLSESKVFHCAKRGKSPAAPPQDTTQSTLPSGNQTINGTTAATTLATTVHAPAVHQESTAPADVSAASSHKWPPPPNTATSTADSKVLLDDDEEAYDGVWLSLNGEGGGEPVTATGGGGGGRRVPDAIMSLSPLPVGQQGTHMLGDFSDHSSVTPARPARVHQPGRPADDAVMRAGNGEAGGEGSELLGDMLGGASDHTAAYNSGTQGRVNRQIIGDDMDDLTASTGPATPPPPPMHTGTSSPPTPFDRSPDARVVAVPNLVAVAGTGAQFAETLKVQDLTLLTEGSRSATPYQDVSGLTPLLGTHLAVSPRAALPAEGDVLLGDGLLSPPVKRATATPQQATLRVEAPVPASAADREGLEARDAYAVSSGPRELRAPPPLLARLSASSTTDSSLLISPNHASVAESTTSAAEADAPPPPITRSSASMDDSDPNARPPVLFSSLPSTVDDGCWKDDDDKTPLRTPPTALLVAAQEEANFRRLLETSAEGEQAAAQETVPIDPFLATPPQFRQRQAKQHIEVESDESGTTTPAKAHAGNPAAARAVESKEGEERKSPKRAAERGGGRTASKSKTPPRGGKPQTPADVDPSLLKVGTPVEGRWGRQWFAAVVSEAPRNGFVQIAWSEDGSLLHVRLREVRLPLQPLASLGSGGGAVNATAADEPSKAPEEGRGGVITATQLVALMEEEDEEDSRREEEQHPTPRVSGTSSTALVAQRSRELLGSEHDGKSKNGPLVDALGGDKGEEPQKETGQTARQRKRGKRSTTPSRSASSSQSSMPPPPQQQQQRQPAAPTPHVALACAAPPLETVPAALCVYLPPSVRRELLMGSCNPVGGGAPSSELQRNTELQRILHYLTSAGATLISSLAQADDVAAQLGDNKGRPTVAGSSAGMKGAGSGSSLPVGTGGGNPATVSAGRRKTANRAPLPRRSTSILTSTPSTAPAHSHAAPSETYFVFLVATPPLAAGVAAATQLVADEHAERSVALQHPPLPEVCVAHAFGVSAIHASWLWSVLPGAPHVRLPTAKEQVTQPPAVPSTSDSLQGLPLRLTPFPWQQRWLRGRAVQFVERDDAMEMWLNAAGAVVTAEPAPPPPSVTAVNTLGEMMPVDASGMNPLAAAPGTRRRSVSLLRAPPISPQPPRKQPRVETRPDLIYIRDTAPATAVDVNKLGSVPVLQLPWLVRGIEENYRVHCSTRATEDHSSDMPATGHAGVLDFDALLPLSVVWEQMQRATPVTVARCKTPPQSGQEKEEKVPAAAALATKAAECVEETKLARDMAKPPSGGCSASKSSTAPADGNLRPFLMLSPDAKAPALRDDAEESAKEREAPVRKTEKRDIGRGLSPTKGETLRASCEEERLRDVIKTVEQAEEVYTSPLPAREAKNTSMPAPLRTYTTPQTVVQATMCSHPPVSLGEDYYVSIAVPSAAALQSGLSQLPRTSSHHQTAAPATTVALGRVVNVHHNLHGGAPLGPLPGSVSQSNVEGDSIPCCCFVELQFYEVKHVSMHVDPRTGGVVQQTTLYLSPNRATVPAAALLFDVPVYVIAAASRQHIYLLEDEGEHCATGALRTDSDAWQQPRMNAQRPGLRSYAAQKESDVVTALERMVSQEHNSSNAASASPAPTSPSRHYARDAHFYDARSHNADAECVEQADKLCRSPKQRPQKFVGAAHRAAEDPVPPPSGVREEGDMSFVHTVTARRALQGPLDAATPRRSTVTSASRAARILPQLTVEVGGRSVTLRPQSRVTFYARHPLSLSQSQRPTTSTRRVDSPSDFPLSKHQSSAQEPSAPPAVIECGDVLDEDSDSSQELIAETPLLGQIELLRKMDGVVDIVLHTEQPNGIFGGSKMYRITPDMILDIITS